MMKELVRNDNKQRHPNWSRVGSIGHKNFDRYGIEIKIDSVRNDGTQSWVVISRSVDKYVTELALDHTQPMHCDERSESTGRPVAIKHKACAVSSVFIILLDERYLCLSANDDSKSVPAVQWTDDSTYWISNVVSLSSSHKGSLREAERQMNGEGCSLGSIESSV